MNDNSLSDIEDFEEITFDFIKSNFFRVIHVDGAIASAHPNGNIHLSLWNERSSIPRQVVYKINPDGVLGEEIDRVDRNSLIREVEVDLILDQITLEKLKLLIDEILKDLNDNDGA